MDTRLAILIFAIAGFSFPIVNVLIGRLLRRDYPEVEKTSTYESGEIPFGDARVKFAVHYYIFALLFVLFDVETVFMYPWAVVFQNLDKAFAFLEMAVFIGMLVIGLYYAYKKKVLRWI